MNGCYKSGKLDGRWRRHLAEIKKRRLGRTNLMVTELGLGTLDTGQVEEGKETISLAVELGINFIDTARIYEGSEYFIGQVIKERGKNDFFLASKTFNRTSDGAQFDVFRSLQFLGVDKIDLYQLHDVSPDGWEEVMGKEGSLAGLKEAQELGMIEHIGLSSHNLQVLEKAITCGEFETVMLDYSAFNLEAEELITLAKEHDVGVIVMRPLGGSGRMSSLKTQMRESEHGLLLSPAVLLTYVLSNPDISVAIPGVRYPSRIRENVDTVLSYQPLSDAEKRACEAEAATLF